jgi:hypothetical protein
MITFGEAPDQKNSDPLFFHFRMSKKETPHTMIACEVSEGPIYVLFIAAKAIFFLDQTTATFLLNPYL